MEHSHDKQNNSKTQSATPDLNAKTIQNKAIELQDNRPASILQRKANQTGLPDNLKSGIENLSGHSMDDVKVHYNSAKPAQLNAHAYAQGTDIHVASGQEKHLPHEAWHVVQQKQGRVQPTLQMKGKVNINNDKGLEKEADIMGAKAIQNTSAATTSLKQVQTVKKTKQLIGWTRWYEYDGENYIARFIGLPSALGWIPMGQHEGKDAYISITNIAKLKQIKDLEQGIDSVRQVVSEYTPLVDSVTRAVAEQGITVQSLHQAQEKFLSLDNALNNYLQKTSTVVKIVATVLGLGTVITGGILLSYLTLPQWLVATVEGLSFLYGAGLLYRWSKSKLLPTMVKIGLLIANGGIMATSMAITGSQIIAYATGLTATMPLQHIQFAAIPLALVLEHFIVLIIEKINALRQFQNNRNGHDEDHRN
ncbi:DUF4157 domain-containing protein [Flavobacterium sp.]|uniref:eCIS core domain-containing protein n=1 Tax=Flavobacterium sp. TaxID=239 RepID=UPI003D6A29D4